MCAKTRGWVVGFWNEEREKKRKRHKVGTSFHDDTREYV